MLTLAEMAAKKMRLEFGNLDQINAIKTEEKRLEEKERKVPWEVEISIYGTATIRVDAGDEDEAIDLAKDEMSAGLLDDFDIQRVSARKL